MKFRFVTKAWKGLVVGNAGTSVVAVVVAKYGSIVGGFVGATAGAAIGFYIDQTYIRGIRWVDQYMRDFGQNIQQQMIFNISNSR